MTVETANISHERTFEDFLEEDGMLEEVDAAALKRVIVWKLEDQMKALGQTKSSMAKRLLTSRTQVDRLLDPDNTKVQLDTIQRAAKQLGLRMMVKLEPIDC